MTSRAAAIGSIGLALLAGCAAGEAKRDPVRDPAHEPVWDAASRTVVLSVGHLHADEIAKTLNDLVEGSRGAARARGCALGPPHTWPGPPAPGTWFSAGEDGEVWMHAQSVDTDEIQAVQGLLERLGASDEPETFALPLWREVSALDTESVHRLARAMTFYTSACPCRVDLIDLRWPLAEAYAT